MRSEQSAADDDGNQKGECADRDLDARGNGTALADAETLEDEHEHRADDQAEPDPADGVGGQQALRPGSRQDEDHGPHSCRIEGRGSAESEHVPVHAASSLRRLSA
jgi:hypothetical protein